MKYDLSNQPSRRAWQGSWSQLDISEEKEYEIDPREHAQEVVKELKSLRTRVASVQEVGLEEAKRPHSSENRSGRMDPPSARARVEHKIVAGKENSSRTQREETQVHADSQTALRQLGGPLDDK